MTRQCLLVGLVLFVAGCGDSARPQTALERAELSLKSGDWDRAIADCSALIAVDPKNAQAFLIRGQAQQCAGRLDEALADLSNAIRLNPEDPEAYYQRADVYRALGQPELKEKDDLAARAHDPIYRQSRLEPEDVMTADPTVGRVAPGGPMTEEDFLHASKREQPKVDLSGAPSPADLPQTKSLAETLFGPPPDLTSDDKPAKRRSRDKVEVEKKPTGGAKLAGIAGGDSSTEHLLPGAGIPALPGTKPGSPVTGRESKGASDKGVAAGADRPRQVTPSGKQKPRRLAGDQVIPGMGDAADDSYRRYLPSERNLRPYDPSTMRSTGVQEFSPGADMQPGRMGSGRIDPYGALSPQNRPGQGPAGPMQPTQPPRGSRATGPSGPYSTQPPGMRYDPLWSN